MANIEKIQEALHLVEKEFKNIIGSPCDYIEIEPDNYILGTDIDDYKINSISISNEDPDLVNIWIQFHLVENNEWHEMQMSYAEGLLKAAGESEVEFPLYGLIENWKGLMEENFIYTKAELEKYDPELCEALESEAEASSSLPATANRTLVGRRLDNKEELVKFLSGQWNDQEDNPTDWYWKNSETNNFYGDDSSTMRAALKLYQRDKMEVFVNEAEILYNNTPDSQIIDADTILADILEDSEKEVTGLALEVFGIWKNSKDRKTVEELFYSLTGVEFVDYIALCVENTTKVEDQ